MIQGSEKMVDSPICDFVAVIVMFERDGGVPWTYIVFVG
jgi:hypothetical protein